MPKHVALVGADLFSAYHDLARGLKEVGALVTGIGATGSTAALPAGLKPWLDAWEPVGNLMDPQAIADAARRAARRPRAARPFRAHRSPLPRQAGDEGGAARGGTALRRVDGGFVPRRARGLRRPRRLPAGAQATRRPRRHRRPPRR